MSYLRLYSILILAAGAAWSQIVLDPVPARTVGRPAAEQTVVTNINPNLGVAGGLDAPQGIAVDTSSHILYVADTTNNRILAWKNASSSTLTNGQAPDKIIGQPNATTTLPGVNGTAGASGLYYPTGLFVDPQGNLYVADSGNNRILRYPTPFGSNNNSGNPDSVLGQPDPFTSNAANQGGTPSATTLAFASNGNVFLVNMTMDSSGNLYVSDPGNNRVLQFPATTLSGCPCTDPAASGVIGQVNLTSATGFNSSAPLASFVTPAGLAFDSAGNFFVTDGSGRIMVFTGISSSSPPMGPSAKRVAGIVSPTPTTATQSTLANPGAIVMINNGPAVADTGYNRILVFDAYTSPDWAVKSGDTTFSQPPPLAVAVIGQTDYSISKANQNAPQPSSGTLYHPVALALAGTDLFVADSANNRVLVFPNNGLNNGASGTASVVLGQSNFPYSGPNRVTGGGFWFNPSALGSTAGDGGVVVDTKANPPHLYVSDPGNNRVLGFADARKAGPGVAADLVIGQPDFSTTVCNYGGVRPTTPATNQLAQQPTQTSLCYPTGLALDPSSGDLFVADTFNGRVVRFPAPFSSGVASLEPANLVVGQSGFTGLKNPAINASFMSLPYGVLYDTTNGLVVSDIAYNRILVFAANSLSSSVAAVKVIGQNDFQTVQTTTYLNQPHHITEDSNARVYVADTGNSRVLIFNSLPDLATSTTISINSITGLNHPQAVWVNPASVAGYPDDIWVGDLSYGVLRLPRYSLLGSSVTSPLSIATAQILPATLSGSQTVVPAVAMTQDGFGALYVADYSNRVGIHYPAVATRNAANFLCAGPLDANDNCTLGGLNEKGYYLAPGAIASLFSFSGVQLVQTPASAASLPLPDTLGGVQMLLNGQPSPLLYAGTGQINFVVPNEAPKSGMAYLQVVSPSTSQILASGSVNMNPVAPGMFTSAQSGIGQIAARNAVDNTVNSASNPVARGAYISLYGTGQGLISGMPPDGEASSGVVSTAQMPTVNIGGFNVPGSAVQYSGLAPGFVGLWQINVQIPNSTAPGSQVPVLVIFENFNSFNDPAHVTTIAVK